MGSLVCLPMCVYENVCGSVSVCAGSSMLMLKKGKSFSVVSPPCVNNMIIGVELFS